jgi:hypothetical protein
MCDSDPPTNIVGPRPMRYLIGSAAGGSLQAVGQALLLDPGVTIRQVIGSQENPVMIVAEMAPEYATLLHRPNTPAS